MKIFDDGTGSWGDKINFVDDNNVLVGFDNDSQCCESFGYFFSKAIPADKEKDAIEVDPAPFNFDPEFFEHSMIPTEYDEGGQVAFKLVNPAGDVVYLNLYNHHNGYYSHGFTCKVGDKVIQDGSI